MYSSILPMDFENIEYFQFDPLDANFNMEKRKRIFYLFFSHLVTALVSPIIIFIIILLSFVVKSVSEKKIMEIGYKNWEWQ